jgi:hypothetical protein
MIFFLKICHYVDNQNNGVNNIVNWRNSLELLGLSNFVSICFSCIKPMKLVHYDIIISNTLMRHMSFAKCEHDLDNRAQL